MMILLVRRTLWAVITFSLLLGSVGSVLLYRTIVPKPLADRSSRLVAQPIELDGGDRSIILEASDLDIVAETLNLSEAALVQALDLSSNMLEAGEQPTPLNLAKVAEKLGVTETDLIKALAMPPRSLSKPNLAPDRISRFGGTSK